MSVFIIAGSRSITDYEFVASTIDRLGLSITEIVEGESPGVDLLARRYGEEHGIPVKKMTADWKNLDAPNAVVKLNRYGKQYNAAAGHDRNQDMAIYGATKNAGCIIIWDGVSNGSRDMRDLAVKYHLTPIHFIKSRPTVRDEGQPQLFKK
jgi:hypothetical protein